MNLRSTFYLVELEKTKERYKGQEMAIFIQKPWYAKKKKEYQGIWVPKTWSGLTSFNARYIWKDTLSTSPQIYYSDGNNNHYVLDTSTSTWSNKSWVSGQRINGQYIWNDGNKIYCQYESFNYEYQYELEPNSNQWNFAAWYGYNNAVYGDEMWTDGTDIYYSFGSNNQYVLNKSEKKWDYKEWRGVTSFQKNSIWIDGDNIYLSMGIESWSPKQYILNKSTYTWETKNWPNWSSICYYLYGGYVWTDGNDMYLSYDADNQYMLNRATSTWERKIWRGSLDNPSAGNIWTDGNHIYHSAGSNHYELT